MCCLSLSFPSLFSFNFIVLFSEPSRFCGLSFFVNRKFEFKYYYTVALSSGAKKKKRNAVIARSFFFFFASGLCLSITCLHYLYFHLSFFEYRKNCSVRVSTSDWIAATNTHTYFFSSSLMSSLSVATIFIRSILSLNTSYYSTHKQDVKRLEKIS